ncbi:MAG: peptidase [Bacteroidetes bacterium]|nr:peptidase [Bacteroidota bacterium]
MFIRKFLTCISLTILSLFTGIGKSNTIDTIPPSALLLSEYVQIPSITGTEKSAGEFLAQKAKEMGLFVQVLTELTDSYNFTASLYPLSSRKPNIVLLTHIDVVDVQEDHYNKYPPFSGIIAEGCVWGRGSLDNKGMGVMQLMALAQFVEKAKQHDLPYNITILAVSNEETGGETGALVVTNQFLEILNPVVVYGEGGSGFDGLLAKDPKRHVYGICVASKRTLWLELTLNVKSSGHGSVPPLNYSIQQKINALERVVAINRIRPLIYCDAAERMFKEVGTIEGGLRGFAYKHIKFFSPFVGYKLKQNDAIYSVLSNTITITSLYTTPGAPNVIPNQTKAILDCRLLPDVNTDAFLKKMRVWLMNDSIKIRIISESIPAPSSIPDQYFYKLKRALKKVYKDAEVISLIVPASDDNNYFRAKGIPTFGILPIFLDADLMSSIHNVNERIPIESLENGIHVYENLIQSILFEPELISETEEK